jgi:hypothetical protein
MKRKAESSFGMGMARHGGVRQRYCTVKLRSGIANRCHAKVTRGEASIGKVRHGSEIAAGPETGSPLLESRQSLAA